MREHKIKSHGVEDYNTWTEKPEGFNKILNWIEESLSELEDKAGELIQFEQEEKKNEKMKIA